MGPLDLTKHPPRPPHDELDGLPMLPRTIDKLRAQLPGGNVGQYRIPGFSERVLKTLNVTEDDLRDAVAKANSDEDVAQWLRAHADTSKYTELAHRLRTRKLGDIEDREDFAQRYPITRGLPPETPLFEIISRDDAEMFSK